MSDEYIKTDDIVKSINVLLDNVDASEDAMYKFCDSMNDIQKVEVVRCKDCKLATKDKVMIDRYNCYVHDEQTRANDFCSYGERAEE